MPRRVAEQRARGGHQSMTATRASLTARTSETARSTADQRTGLEPDHQGFLAGVRRSLKANLIRPSPCPADGLFVEVRNARRRRSFFCA